jgi:hypothetical protein
MYSKELWHCERGECEAVCLAQGGKWFTPLPNFDNTANGIWALFVITTLEGWMNVLYDAVDSRGVLLQPIQRERLGWSWRQDLCAAAPRHAPDPARFGAAWLACARAQLARLPCRVIRGLTRASPPPRLARTFHRISNASLRRSAQPLPARSSTFSPS